PKNMAKEKSFTRLSAIEKTYGKTNVTKSTSSAASNGRWVWNPTMANPWPKQSSRVTLRRHPHEKNSNHLFRPGHVQLRRSGGGSGCRRIPPALQRQRHHRLETAQS